MLEFFGPIVVVVGTICLPLSWNINKFFSLPNINFQEIENDHITTNLIRLLNLENLDFFKDPLWVSSFRRRYHKNIKDIGNAELCYENMINCINNIKIILLTTGIISPLIGVIITLDVNLNFIQNPKSIIFIAETLVILFYINISFFIFNNFIKYKNNKHKYNEIYNSQFLITQGVPLEGI